MFRLQKTLKRQAVIHRSGAFLLSETMMNTIENTGDALASMRAAMAATGYRPRMTLPVDDDRTITEPTEDAPRNTSFSEALDIVVRAMEADTALVSITLARLAHYLPDASEKVSLAPFPADFGTVECSIWDNQPGAKLKRISGDKSRARVARFAVKVKACRAGHKSPLTAKSPDFVANICDLFTASQIRQRIIKNWVGMDTAEIEWLEANVLTFAEANGYLVARMMLTQSGRHWHAYHYLLVSEDELMTGDVTKALLWVGPNALYILPPFAKVDGKGQPFKPAIKQTASGERRAIVVGQSRATDLVSAGMRAWATGAIETN